MGMITTMSKEWTASDMSFQGSVRGAQYLLPYHRLNGGRLWGWFWTRSYDFSHFPEGFLWASSFPSYWSISQCNILSQTVAKHEDLYLICWAHLLYSFYFFASWFYLLLCIYVLNMPSIHQRAHSYSELNMILRDWQRFLLQYVYTKQNKSSKETSGLIRQNGVTRTDKKKPIR